MDAWDTAFLDLAEPAFILFEDTSSAFAFGCVTGAFAWDGADEMEAACGDDWVKLQDDGSLVGEITFHNGDESGFIAHRWQASSTAC